MFKLKQFIILAAALLIMTPQLNAQRGPVSRKASQEKTEKNKSDDSTKKVKAKGPVTIEKFIKPSVKPMVGVTTVYKQDGKFFININDSILGRDFIMVTRISKAAEGIRTTFEGYSGDQINSGVFRFEKGPDNNIFLRQVKNNERSKDSTQSMYAAVQRSNLEAIITTFDIEAQSEDKSDNIIDVTSFFNSDLDPLFFTKRYKSMFKLGGIKKESSYIEDISTYPINTEVKSVKTFSRTVGGENATYVLNNSFVLLPKVPMTPRYSDDRVGYFTTGYTDYDIDPQGVKKIRMITRWRLEPKPEDVEKYKRGELVEPAKPIVFYIDPTTPKEWVPYLIQGVNDWQASFEAAGFKNAIYALEAPTPEENPEWSLEDARHSAIVYKPSETPNASGPNVNDPRSGEIIESHVNWYHNVMSLVRNWYFVQCSPVDPGARKMTFDTELMGQLIRFVSSHEVGHTLGLRHNFAGTATYTTDQLRDPEFLKENGHTTSIMDYSRFNFVAQPGDNIPRELLFPRINHYDTWAIEWGYRRFPEIDDPNKELTKVNNWIIEKTKDRRYWFGKESSASDPRLQSEDLSDNHMEANELGIKNLKFIMDNLAAWTATPNEDYSNLRTMHSEVNKQFTRYIGHVAKWVGGVYEEPKTIEMEGDVFTIVEKAKQVEAMDFLDRHLFQNAPEWLVPYNYLNKFPSRAESYLERAYSKAISSLLSRRVIMNLVTAQTNLGDQTFTVEDLFNRLDKSVWSNKGRSVDAYNRVLQKTYVTTLGDLYSGAAAQGMRGAKPTANPKDITECTAVAYYQLNQVLNMLKKTRHSDFVTSAHNNYLIGYIEKVLEAPVTYK
ncbi:MAG: zinc-dependent metalloprotease [Bacteroidales bacterium]|nr:zinc-dependent metalloprotease [Bacteroidales bacterium]